MKKGPMQFTVTDVAAHLGKVCPSGHSNLRFVTHLVLDSRAVCSDIGFVALPGEHNDGRLFFAQALAQNPPVIIYESTGIEICYTPEALASLQSAYPQTAFVPVQGLRKHLASLARLIYPIDSAELKVAAVTGTNGKTTVASWVTGACHQVNPPVGFSGTLGLGVVGKLSPSANTTPDIFTLSRWLHNLAQSGGRFAMLEASSHALAQNRMEGLPIHTAVWTQVTQDHLDYHGTFEAYAAEKRKLLSWPGLKYCVINLADFTARQAFESGVFAGKALTYEVVSTDDTGDCSYDFTNSHINNIQLGQHYKVEHISFSFEGMQLSMLTPSGRWFWSLPFWGRHNAENALAALLTMISFGWQERDAAEAIANQPLPAGRLERFTCSGRPTVIVDYAHTPDALSHLLKTVRAHAQGKIWVVFGCGGDRDQGKRSQMGAIAAQLADNIVLTNDNPRSEHPQAIVDQIAQGVLQAGGLCQQECDRAKAVALALAQAREEDVVVVAGKGHETYQDIAGKRLEFSDRLLVSQLLGLKNNNDVIQLQELST